MRTKKKWIIIIGLLAVAAAAGDSIGLKSIKEFYSANTKAFYLADPTVQFVRPGLVITIQSASVAADGTISTTFKIADPQGLPLDRTGVTTPGVVTLSFVAAYIPASQEQYVSYTTRVATGPVVASTNQAGSDAGGTYTALAAGQYTYTFGTKAPAGFDTTATHTIGIYGNRNLATFNLPTNYASTTFNFVPNGSPVTKTRDVVRDASCDRCHDQLSFHGGSRRGVAMCVLCHTPQTLDPDTGNTVDFKVFIHKVHMGAKLPSVIAGKPYQIIGFNNSVADYSDVVFPADVRRCQVCHDSSTKAAQTNAWLTTPTRATCGACHDNVNFASGANHPAGAYNDDTQCATCHQPQGASDFDASIMGAHTVQADSSLLSGLVAAITNVTSGTAGNKPVVTFTVKDKNGNAVPLSALGTLTLTMSGPTQDYGYVSFGSDVTTSGYVSESGLRAPCGADGTCTYSFTHAIPGYALGTYAIGIETRRTETILAGTPKQQNITYGAANPVYYFSVDGSAVVQRRQIISQANCQQCHVRFTTIHGSLRNNVEYCVLCHNPSMTDSIVRGSAVNAADRALPAQGVNFNMLVHRIHAADKLAADGSAPYVVVGFGGSHNDFSDVGFPAMRPTGATGDTRNCSNCHVNASEQKLPTGKVPVMDPQGPIQPWVQSVAAACRGCHTTLPAASHMVANTTAIGESCEVCHGSGRDVSVAQVHAQY